MPSALPSRDALSTIGFVSASMATVVAAYGLFPDDPTPRGALMLPAAVMTLGILVVPLMRVLAGSRDITNAETFLCLGFVFWLLLDLLQGAYELGDASYDSLQLALASIGVSAACLWLGVRGREWRPPDWVVSVATRPLDARTITRLVPVCFVIGMLNFAYACDFDIPLMFSYIGDDRWAAPWSRGQLGGWGSFVDQMPYFGYVLPSLAALLIAKRGLLRFESLIAIACSVIMLLFLSQGGGRRVIGVTVGAALLVWIQANPGLRLKNIVIIGVSAVALAWTSQFMLNIRTGGIEQFRATGSQLDYLHVDDNFLRLAQVIEMVPRRRDHVGMQQIVFTLVRPVPRVFWPGKPIDPGFDLAKELGMPGVSLSTTIIGEWYLAFGWLAVMFGGWFHGRLARAANAIRDETRAAGNPIVYALAVMVLVSGQRSMLDLVVMSYALVAWWAVNRYFARRLAAAA